MAVARIVVACYRFATNKTIRQGTCILPRLVAIADTFVHGKAMCHINQAGISLEVSLRAYFSQSGFILHRPIAVISQYFELFGITSRYIPPPSAILQDPASGFDLLALVSFMAYHLIGSIN